METEIKKGDWFIAKGIDQSIEILDIKKGEVDPEKPNKDPKWFFHALIRRNGFTDNHKLEIEVTTPKLLDTTCYERKRVVGLFL